MSTTARAALAALGVAGCLWCGACRETPQPTGRTEPLFGAEDVVDVLVEVPEPIAIWPSTTGRRFVAGWWPQRLGSRWAVLPTEDGGRLEITRVLRRKQTLRLEAAAPTDDVQVRIFAAGRDLGQVPIVDGGIEVELPENLPIGRVPIDVRSTSEPWDAEQVPRVLSARVTPSMPPGDARRIEDDLEQSGPSIADLVRPVPAWTRLRGRVEAPHLDDPRGADFQLTVLAAGDRVVDQVEIRHGRGFDLEVSRDEPGLRRFRFRSLDGTTIRWRDLELYEVAHEEADVPVAAPERAATEGNAEPAGPPKLVVVYVMDALRADAVGHLGGPAGVSPTWDRLAAEGATFAHHFSVAPNTLPSTKALFLGRPVVEHGGWPIPEDGPPTLAEHLRAAGYRTGLFSGNPYVGPAYGSDRGFEHQQTEGLGGEPADGAARPFNHSAEKVQRAALDWLATIPEDEQVFLYLHTIHPHNPYDPPTDLGDRFTAGIPSSIDGSTSTLLDVQKARRPVDEADHRRLRGLYDAAFAYNDRRLEEFLAALATRAAPEDTLVVLTSDHGEEIFDHGGVLHGYTLYDEMLHIPLTLWAPGRVAPRRVEARTDTLDLHTTLVRWLAPGADAPSQGRDLQPLLQTGQALAPRPHLAAAASVEGGIYALRTDTIKLVWAPRTGSRWGQGQGLGRSQDAEAIFDLAADPGETRNLAADADADPRIRLEADRLRGQLQRWIETQRADGLSAGDEAPESVTDEETLESLRALGYVDDAAETGGAEDERDESEGAEL